MADDETVDATEPVDATEESKPEKSARSGVTLPAWALGALVVVAALAIGGIGYAIGNSNDDSRNLINPIGDVRSAPGDSQGNGGACPSPFGGRDGGQLQPGPGGNGPGGLPGGPLGPGFGPGGDEDRGERGDQDQNGDQNQDQDQEQNQESESSI